MEQLRERKVVRSENNPVADYCQSLVARALKLTRLSPSNKGCNAVDGSNQTRYEIKGRRITKHNPSTQLSVIRDLDSRPFDYLVGVLFNDDFAVTDGYLVPCEVVKRSAAYKKHVNGWILHLKPELRERPGVRDITTALKKAQSEWA